jgi:nitric oxide reductase subunit B
MVFGLMTAAGGGLLFWDLLKIGHNEERPAAVIGETAMVE